MSAEHRSFGIVGGGPAALFVFKELLASGHSDFSVSIFEANDELGKGMPYSKAGANSEHVTNVSGNEIPELMKPVIGWVKTLPDSTLEKYKLAREHLHDFMVLPRLLFGEYLQHQFNILLKEGEAKGINTRVYLSCRVTDIKDSHEKSKVSVETSAEQVLFFDHVIICSGHVWPLLQEGKIPGFYDSPYPPAKLNKIFDHEIAIRGSSLTAIDAIRTLARNHGIFHSRDGRIVFDIDPGTPDFKIILHSKQGLLPALRFHLDDPKLGKNSLLSKEEILEHILQNDGFLSLDFIFEKNFKDAFKDKDPGFYEFIKDMGLEEFVQTMMRRRETTHPFKLFRLEYIEAAESINERESIYWKEMLAVLSFAMNYPAKHFSAEDMLRLQKVLQPLIAVVIAFVPQDSADELLALYEAGRLDLIAVGDNSNVEAQSQGGVIYFYTDEKGESQENYYQTFIDCTGQQPLSLEQFPFPSLIKDESVSAAKIKFRSGKNVATIEDDEKNRIEQNEHNQFFLKVPGIAITDTFRIIDTHNTINPRIYVMAVSCIGGFNPDYSGLDFCEEAAKIIAGDLLRTA